MIVDFLVVGDLDRAMGHRTTLDPGTTILYVRTYVEEIGGYTTTLLYLHLLAAPAKRDGEIIRQLLKKALYHIMK